MAVPEEDVLFFKAGLFLKVRTGEQMWRIRASNLQRDNSKRPRTLKEWGVGRCLVKSAW